MLIEHRLIVERRHSAHLFVKTADIESDSPQPKTHTMQGDSGNWIERAWCDECGCGLWIKPSTKPDMTCLKAGKYRASSLIPTELPGHGHQVEHVAGLFQPGEIPNPTMENWLKNKEPWETPATGTQRTSDGQ